VLASVWYSMASTKKNRSPTFQPLACSKVTVCWISGSILKSWL